MDMINKISSLFSLFLRLHHVIMKALLVIDMQNGSFTEATPRHDAGGVVARINELACFLRRRKDAVVVVQHDGTAQGNFLPHTPEWEMLPGLELLPGDARIRKTANDCFYESGLGPFLQEKGIRELVVTGCASDFCVDTTVKAALARDYHITVIADGHTTADRPGIGAADVVRYYNWIWANMLPTRGSLRVLTTKEYLAMES
jgi:nicotinamidase-related amidase